MDRHLPGRRGDVGGKGEHAHRLVQFRLAAADGHRVEAGPGLAGRDDHRGRDRQPRRITGCRKHGRVGRLRPGDRHLGVRKTRSECRLGVGRPKIRRQRQHKLLLAEPTWIVAVPVADIKSGWVRAVGKRDGANVVRHRGIAEASVGVERERAEGRRGDQRGSQGQRLGIRVVGQHAGCATLSVVLGAMV